MFFVWNFKIINWEHVEFDEGKSHFLLLFVVYLTFRTAFSSMNSSEKK